MGSPDFNIVDWAALGSTVPAMLALTFFGVLHVPINVPALALSTGEDGVDVDRELRAHGISNALSGLCGSIQVGSDCSTTSGDQADVKTELPCIHQYSPFHEKWRR